MKSQILLIYTQEFVFQDVTQIGRRWNRSYWLHGGSYIRLNKTHENNSLNLWVVWLEASWKRLWNEFWIPVIMGNGVGEVEGRWLEGQVDGVEMVGEWEGKREGILVNGGREGGVVTMGVRDGKESDGSREGRAVGKDWVGILVGTSKLNCFEWYWTFNLSGELRGSYACEKNHIIKKILLRICIFYESKNPLAGFQ